MTHEKIIERLEVMKDCYMMFFDKSSDCRMEEKYEENKEAFEGAVAALRNPSRINWIPIETRPLTPEETEQLVTEYGLDASFYTYPSSFRYICPLPEDGEDVLVTTRAGCVIIVEYHDDTGFDEEEEADSFKAWARLPKPYGSEVQHEDS